MKRFGRVATCLLAAALSAVFAVSGYQIWAILQERQAAEASYQELDSFLQFGRSDSGTGQPRQDGAATVTDGAADLSISFPEVDFEGLRSINEQVVGWIYDESSVINYPIAQARDNDYYLHRMFNGESNPCGCIFLDCRNQSDFSDSHCIVYGHHMKNGSMFAALSNYKSQEYYEAHPRMFLLTPEGNYTIEIFAGYVAHVEDDAWVTGFASETDYEDWIVSGISKSLVQADFAPSASDRVLTLSTCSYEFQDARFVLLGVLRAE
ncbi:class B sortase [uncultured Acetatifactor sp.]|uniref:class B sortase n=1 Tax=uncultured Acetatifactor sp. TaxID=1671927 RepID=UPI002604E556|nr:class B sortase [uncultured Acetatifactor sp.]